MQVEGLSAFSSAQEQRNKQWCGSYVSSGGVELRG